MKFEFDPYKSEINKKKHGIDFEEAQLLWDDVYVRRIPAFTVDGEVRYMVIGKISDKHYAAILAKGILKFLVNNAGSVRRRQHLRHFVRHAYLASLPAHYQN